MCVDIEQQNIFHWYSAKMEKAQENDWANV